ncbi:hypothetical protein LguiA_028619 [Lonicera macranthoides]
MRLTACEQSDSITTWYKRLLSNACNRSLIASSSAYNEFKEEHRPVNSHTQFSALSRRMPP